MSGIEKKVLSEKNYEKAIKTLDGVSDINKVYSDILSNEKCDNCEFKNEHTKKILPIINSSADIMIITENVSQKEVENGQLLSDPKGIVLLAMLNLLKTDINNIYITPISKCYSKEIQFNTALRCTSKYILREVQHVKPKMIITLGELPMKIVKAVFFDVANYKDLKLADEIKGVHKLTKDNSTMEGLDTSINFIHTISPKRILKLKGDKQKKFKNILWGGLNKIDKFIDFLNNEKKKEDKESA